MQNTGRYQQARKVTLIGALTNLVLAILKVIFGIIGHSQALFADGIHSFSDLVTDFLVLMVSKAGSREPDIEHPYGHGRIETIATIVLAVLLLVVAFGIVLDAVHSILHLHFIRPAFFGLVVALISILANEWIFRYTLRVGKRIGSNLLNANAWHHRSDALSSLVVLVGIGGSILGFHYWDSVAAIIVALMIVHMGLKMIWASVKELIDTGVDEAILQNILEQILNVNGVKSAHQLRTRLVGGWIFVEAHILVDSHISVSEGHYVGDQIIKSLMKDFPKISDVVIHVDPEDDSVKLAGVRLLNRKALKKKLKNCWNSLPGYSQATKMNLHYLRNKIEIELFLPLSVLTKDDIAEGVVKQYQEAVKKISFVDSVKVYFE
jgi:cation diffusion facilitator family transporter